MTNKDINIEDLGISAKSAEKPEKVADKEQVDIQYLDYYVSKINFANKALVEKGVKRTAELKMSLEKNPKDATQAAIGFDITLKAVNPDNVLCHQLDLTYVGLMKFSDKKGLDHKRLLAVDGAKALYPKLQEYLATISKDTKCPISISAMDFEAAYDENIGKK